jgi:hypothetical protein
VAGEHDSGGPFRVDDRKGIAAYVRTHAIGKALGFVAPDSKDEGPGESSRVLRNVSWC